MAGHRKNSSPSKRVVVSWGHGRGNAWVDLIDNGDGTYSYRSDNGGGYLGRMTRGQAIMEMEKRMGHLTPDAYKTKLRIKNPAGKPRRSTSLAGLDPSKKWHRKCPFCSAKTNIDRLGSSSRTWQQWRCPECGKWVDRPEASRRNPSEMPRPTKRGVRRHGQGSPIGVTIDYVGGMGDDEYRVRFNGRVIARAFMSPHGGGKENWSVEPLDDSGTWKAGVANGMRAAHAMVKLEALKMMKRVKRRINPGLGMPGMPHTWVTANGAHVSAGDQVEFWSSEGGYGDRKKVRRKGTVMRYLVFDDHVQVKKGSFGVTVDDSNFIRVTRRGR